MKVLFTTELLTELASEIRGGIIELSSLDAPAVRRIEQILRACGGTAGPRFPNQWCDFASCVLGGHIARETSRGDVLLVQGEGDGPFNRHWWIQCGEHIVDVTCDQFTDGPKCPLVTRTSRWHKRLFGDVSIEPIAARRLMEPYFERGVTALTLALDQLDGIKAGRRRRRLSGFDPKM